MLLDPSLSPLLHESKWSGGAAIESLAEWQLPALGTIITLVLSVAMICITPLFAGQSSSFSAFAMVYSKAVVEAIRARDWRRARSQLRFRWAARETLSEWLSEALRRGDDSPAFRSLIQHLIQIGANANDEVKDMGYYNSDYSVTRPLHMAARRCHFATVKCLISLGADVNSTDYAQQTALMSMAEGGIRDFSASGNMLLHAFANIENLNFSAVNRAGESLLHYLCRADSFPNVNAVALEKWMSIIRIVHSNDPRLVLQPDNHGRLPIHNATHLAIIRLLHEELGSPIGTVDDAGYTPFSRVMEHSRYTHSFLRALGRIRRQSSSSSSTDEWPPTCPIEWFISKGIDVDSGRLVRHDAADDPVGTSPPPETEREPLLMHASTYSLTKRLLDCGATVHRSKVRKTCEWSTVAEKKKILQLLLDAGVDLDSIFEDNADSSSPEMDPIMLSLLLAEGASFGQLIANIE